jgi:Mg2+ and Co2+ transporter CorA
LSVTAIPLTLTFAFFGMNTRNVDPATSFLSVHDYTWFYGLLLILVVLAATLFAIFWLLGRRYFNLIARRSRPCLKRDADWQG